MTKDIRNKACLLLFCLLCCLPLAAQTTGAATVEPASVPLSQRSIPESAWQKLSSDPDITRYRDLVETEQEKKAEQPPRESRSNWLEHIIEFFASGFGKLLLWVFIAVIVLYIAYSLIAGQGRFTFRKEKVFDTGDTGDNAEDLGGSDWDKRMEDAMAAGDTRLAVRFGYMRLLQLLQERELIRYRIDKTNHDYYYELADSPYKQPFRQLSRRYEYAWYGNYSLSADAFSEYLGTLRTIKNDLKAL